MPTGQNVEYPPKAGRKNGGGGFRLANSVYAMGISPFPKLLRLFTDRIKASVDTFGGKPELYGSIVTTAVAVMSLLVSEVKLECV